jgi:hypothetical protein
LNMSVADLLKIRDDAEADQMQDSIQ